MGELHLEIYVERLKREYGVNCKTGKPKVAFKETLSKRMKFSYTHKKQSGGSGQYAKVIGYIEKNELEEDEEDEINDFEENSKTIPNEFVNATVGMNIPSGYIPGVEKGFLECCDKGLLAGHPICGVRFVLEDGLSHAVDSSEMGLL